MTIGKFLKLTASSAILALCLSNQSQAGPFILDLTDADDHGSASATDNFDGWLYMQKVLENLAPGVTNGKKLVVQLGATDTASSTDSFDAAKSSFDKSALVGAGWTWINIDGASDIEDFFDGTGVGCVC